MKKSNSLESDNDLFGTFSGFIFLLLATRLVYGVVLWLKDGEWYKIYGCQLIDLEKILCNPTSSWEGINKILNFVGTTDVLWFILLVLLIAVAQLRQDW